MNITELKRKYNIKPRPRYYGRKDIQTLRASTPKGQLLFDLDIEQMMIGGKVYSISTGPMVKGKKRVELKSVDAVDLFLTNADLGSVQDRVFTDDEVIRYLGRQLQLRFQPEHFMSFTYIKWKNSIQLNDPINGRLPYNQFRERTGHQDDNYELGPICMTLVDFESWLLKMGARKVTRPKRVRETNYYD